ncbi:hypothetical protein GCM10009733_020660 [Nonomuraea maheshkhaliensis]|uniref:Uncharacterized protein n=1 Tax=Nonomuraea maheshkhaliensis TaxID=419590 RepID=A0ABN2EZS2_9ACTN
MTQLPADADHETIIAYLDAHADWEDHTDTTTMYAWYRHVTDPMGWVTATVWRFAPHPSRRNPTAEAYRGQNALAVRIINLIARGKCWAEILDILVDESRGKATP